MNGKKIGLERDEKMVLNRNRKEDGAMKSMARGTMLAIILALMIFAAGCMIIDESTDDCCNNDVYYDWEPYGPDINSLYVGEECAGCGACCAGCWSDYDYSIDTLEFTCLDDDILDLQFNFTLTNWGNQTTLAWVSLCDSLGCEDVIEIDLLPGEVYWARVPNPVLDTALDDYFDCLYYFDQYCFLYYDVEVWLGEEYTCSPVTLDYYFEGLYAY